MAIWAIVPVKPFERGKSRLSSVLSLSERAGLSRQFLGHTLAVLAQVPAVTITLVVSRDPAALALARERGARTVSEAGAPGLNGALERATLLARTEGADAVLILPADLPFLSADDVRQLTAAPAGERLVTIAPDRHEAGTNALFVRPPGLLRYAFGANSFTRHVALADRAGAQVRVCRLPGAALDVDVPDDWRLYQSARKP